MVRERPEITDALADAFKAGDEGAFAAISRRHFRELHVHCYRMLGSFDDAEDLVQETLLRAWNRRGSYEGRAGIRAWLYRIATNVCIDTIRARRPRGGPEGAADASPYAHVSWLQPYPDTFLDAVEAEDLRPDARVVSRETIELHFLATIQQLPPKPRAVLILRDILEFSAAQTARILDDSVPAVNSALQRARATVQHRRRTTRGTAGPVTATFDEAVLLQVFIDAQQRGDVDAMVALLRDDVQMTLFPDCETWDGRDEVAREFLRRAKAFDGQIRSLPVAANRQPALGVYIRRAGDAEYRPWAVVLLGVVDGKLREIATFASPDVFARFQLPATLPARPPS